MARAPVRLGKGGGALDFAVEQPYFLQKMPGNPMLGAQHDGKSTGFRQGYSVKPIDWLTRFRYNSLPPGHPTGFYTRNPGGKLVHHLEVSTIEKVRLQTFSEEAIPPTGVSIFCCIVTAYYMWRYYAYHPDLTMYNVALWTSKPFMTMFRASAKHRMDQPVFRNIQRVPELYIEDPQRELYKLGIAANDPFVQRVKDAGRESELYIEQRDFTPTKPHLRDIFEGDGPVKNNSNPMF